MELVLEPPRGSEDLVTATNFVKLKISILTLLFPRKNSTSNYKIKYKHTSYLLYKRVVLKNNLETFCMFKIFLILLLFASNSWHLFLLSIRANLS